MSKLINLIAASGLALLMAACETAPVVVEDLPPPDSSVSRELLILPLAGLSSTVGNALGEKMAWGMREAGYPARSASLSNDVNPMLTGWIEEANVGEDIIWLNINWALYGAGGTLVGSYRQETAVSRNGWMKLSPDTLAVIVTQAVPAIHEIAEVEVYPDGLPDFESRDDEPSVIELTAPPQETIVVSGEGLSRIDTAGNEVADQQLSVAAEPTFAPDYEPDTTSSGYQVPDDDVGRLTPETAALVTTTPELTISETIMPEQGDTVAGSRSAQELEPQQVTMAPGVQAEANAQAQITETPPTPVVEQQPAQSVVAVKPQPTLADGNAALGFVRPVFLVRHVTGAPGDGNLALRTAMLKSLREADATVTDNPAQASYVIQGNVQIAAPFAARQHIRIVWLVTTITGEEVGTAIQENDIPQGSLDGKWGGVAQAVANAAIPGVAQLFETGLDAGTAQGTMAQPDLPHMIEDTAP